MLLNTVNLPKVPTPQTPAPTAPVASVPSNQPQQPTQQQPTGPTVPQAAPLGSANMINPFFNQKAGTLQQHVEDLIGQPTTSDTHAMSEHHWRRPAGRRRLSHHMKLTAGNQSLVRI